MNDKPRAGVLAALVAIPLMVLCCVAPLLVLSSIAAIIAWIGGVDPVSALLIALIAAGVALRIRQRRKCIAPAMEQLTKDEK